MSCQNGGGGQGGGGKGGGKGDPELNLGSVKLEQLSLSREAEKAFRSSGESSPGIYKWEGKMYDKK